MDQLATINGLVRLHCAARENSSKLANLKSLEELVHLRSDLVDVECLASKLANLKRVHFYKTRFEDTATLFKRAATVENISIERFDEQNEVAVINVPELNRQRQQLAAAQQITFYVPEKEFLATKSAYNETNFGLIRLKRFQSLEWENDFYKSQQVEWIWFINNITSGLFSSAPQPEPVEMMEPDNGISPEPHILE